MTAETRAGPRPDASGDGRGGLPTLSVVIANRNNAPYLRECLDSVLGQSYRATEIVVCDDASDDSSAALLSAYARAHPATLVVLGNDRRRGVARTRRRALEAARGRYVTTLDSDDFYREPGKLEAEMELVLRHDPDHAGRAVAFSDVEIVDADGTPRATMSQFLPLLEGELFSAILGRSCLIPRDFVCARQLYFECGAYDRRLSLYEDWDLKLRLARRARFHYTGRVGTAYRRHGRGLSSRGLFQHCLALWRVFRRHIGEVPREERAEVERRFRDFLTELRTQLSPGRERASDQGPRHAGLSFGGRFAATSARVASCLLR